MANSSWRVACTVFLGQLVGNSVAYGGEMSNECVGVEHHTSGNLDGSHLE